MTKKELKKLRTIFRRKMKKRDFCIGEYEVEKLFRELLGEPEPKPKVIKNVGTNVNLVTDLVREYDRILPKLKNAFDRDDSFYSSLNKKK